MVAIDCSAQWITWAGSTPRYSTAITDTINGQVSFYFPTFPAALRADHRERRQGLFERSQRVIPGGVNSPVRAFGSVGGTPIFFTRGEGAWLTDAEGHVVKEGRRDLRDLAFLMKITMAFRDDSVRHEKAMLDDWLRAEFPRVRKS